jgi:hypothetical protein
MTTGAEARGDARARFTPVPSLISVPAEIKMSFIEETVNRQMSGTIYTDNAFPVEGFGNVRLTVRRSGRIRMRAVGNELIYTAPLRVSMRVSITILGHTEHKDAEAGLTLRLRSRMTLRSDWRLATTTTVEGYEWTDNPVIRIRMLTIPVKPIADAVISRQLNTISGVVDRSISSAINVREIITQHWEQLQTPTKISAPGAPQRLWLRFDPSEIYMSPLIGTGDAIKATLGIRAVTETFFGDKPKTGAPKPLPNFKPPAGPDSSFTINLFAEMPFDRATEICREAFVGKTFRSGLQRVTVHDIEIFGANGLVGIRMDLSGSIKGTVNVIGRAVYNEQTQTLSIDDFDFDVETNSKYQRARNWLLRGIIASRMKPHMRFPLGETLDEAKTLIQEVLTGRELYDGIALKGRINALGVRGVEVTDNTFRAAVLATGTAVVQVGGGR